MRWGLAFGVPSGTRLAAMITLNKLTKRFGPKVLFENVSLTFDPGKRYVIVGANGAGKSTLIKVISGDQDADGGSVEIPSKLKIGVLKQTTRSTTTAAFSTPSSWATKCSGTRCKRKSVCSKAR
ncbi:MAG: ATP-binding cassette domain-containing protein [Polyangiaceae bacterium]